MRVRVIGFIVGMGLATGASAQGVRPAAEAEQLRARQRIFIMEGVLEHAVQLGVDNLRRRVRAVMPDDALLQGGAPQVRGFRLEGYGVFFDVEVPALRRSLAWSLRTMNETGGAVARDLAAMRSLVQSIPDARVRAEFELSLRRLQQQVGPMAPPAPLRADRGATAAPGATVTAQSVVMPPMREPAEPQPQLVDPALVNDPSEAYTEEVKATMIDAMIEHSSALMLADSEWLAVAARDNAPAGAYMPGDPDVVTLVLRVRGSDLNAFRAGRLTLEQVRARVEVAEF